MRTSSSLLLVPCLLSAWSSNAAGAQTITLDGSKEGRTFEGIGGASAGASSRLLIDYPEPYRSQILDYLFKPNYGAGFQHLKVEVGGDVNSTDGVESSHMHTRTDENYNRGYEWFLMKEAKARNPNVILDCLEWGAPGWIGNGKFYSQDNADYLVKFIKGAKTVHGLTMDYVGIWNEKPYDTTWIKLLRSTLDAAGLTSVRITAADQLAGANWNIVDSMKSDPALSAAVYSVNNHYPGTNSTQAAKDSGKPLWSAEDGPWNGTWSGAQSLAKTYNRNYINGKITKTEIWSPITSYYDILLVPGSGVMRANTPWSSHYEVQPAVWATAHTTQFAQPGWKYLDGTGNGFLTTAGSYVALKSPNGTDYSIVIETIDTGSSQTVTFNLTGGLSTGVVHVWHTSSSTSFEALKDITPSGGSFTITLDGGSIYSLTTTTGQTKGSAQPPPASPFPVPYVADFECEALGTQAQYFSDQSGAWEITSRPDGMGQSMRQVMTQKGILWHGSEADPQTILGEPNWADYDVSSDVYIESSGYAALYGRMSSPDNDATLNAYGLKVDQAGTYTLFAQRGKSLASGKTAFSANAWHRLELAFSGTTITGYVDGAQVAKVSDGSFKSGLAGVGSGWNAAQFDHFVIQMPGVNGGLLPDAGADGGSRCVGGRDGGLDSGSDSGGAGGSGGADSGRSGAGGAGGAASGSGGVAAIGAGGRGGAGGAAGAVGGAGGSVGSGGSGSGGASAGIAGAGGASGRTGGSGGSSGSSGTDARSTGCACFLGSSQAKGTKAGSASLLGVLVVASLLCRRRSRRQAPGHGL